MKKLDFGRDSRHICFYPGFMLETMFFKKAFNCMEDMFMVRC